MRVHTPKPNRGWDPEGTATWQKAEAARQALIAWMSERQRVQGCPGCQGRGYRVEPTIQHPAVQVHGIRVVCPHCRPEDWKR